MKNGLQSGFTLIEVMVATGVMVVLSALSLATTWRLVRNARDCADLMVADAYCQQVLFAVLSNSKLIDKFSNESWTIDPAKGLPYIVSTSLFGNVTTNYPLWRTKSKEKYPRCTVKKDDKNIVVDIEWTDAYGKKCQLPRPLEAPLDPDSEEETK